MDRSQEIIRTSWIGIAANVLLAGFKAAVGILAWRPDFHRDHQGRYRDAAFACQLTREIQPLVPDMQVAIVVDHNYSE